MKDDIIRIIDEKAHGISEETLAAIAEKIEDLYNDRDHNERIVDVELLEKVQKTNQKLTAIMTNVEPQTTEDILWVNDLKEQQYRLELLIHKL